MHQRHLPRFLLCIGFLGLSASGLAQENVQKAQEQLGLASSAHQSGDFAAQVRHLEAALALNPASLRTRYNLACAYALRGDQPRALGMLDQLVELGVDYGMADDPELRSLRDLPDFATMLRRLGANAQPMGDSRPVATIEELGLIPEGIARDGATRRIFFGSMRTGDVYVLHEAGHRARFASINVPGFSAIGMAVDERRRLLWTIGTATDFAKGEPHGQLGTAIEDSSELGTAIEDSSQLETAIEDSTSDDPGGSQTGTATNGPPPGSRAAVFAFDIETGINFGRFFAEPSIEGFNDVAVAPNGDVYLSGSRLAVVAPEKGEIHPLPTSPLLIGTNGIVVSPDGATLFTSVYPVGIAAVDLESGQAHFLDLPESTTLYGIDGLYLHKGDLVAVQNGTAPWRLLRIELDDRQRKVTRIRTLERANPDFTPTTGAIAGNEILLIGQGPAPDPAPTDVPEWLVPFFGKTLIMAAPLD